MEMTCFWLLCAIGSRKWSNNWSGTWLVIFSWIQQCCCGSSCLVPHQHKELLLSLSHLWRWHQQSEPQGLLCHLPQQYLLQLVGFAQCWHQQLNKVSILLFMHIPHVLSSSHCCNGCPWARLGALVLCWRSSFRKVCTDHGSNILLVIQQVGIWWWRSPSVSHLLWWQFPEWLLGVMVWCTQGWRRSLHATMPTLAFLIELGQASLDKAAFAYVWAFVQHETVWQYLEPTYFFQSLMAWVSWPLVPPMSAIPGRVTVGKGSCLVVVSSWRTHGPRFGLPDKAPQSRAWVPEAGSSVGFGHHWPA